MVSNDILALLDDSVEGLDELLEVSDFVFNFVQSSFEGLFDDLVFIFEVLEIFSFNFERFLHWAQDGVNQGDDVSDGRLIRLDWGGVQDLGQDSEESEYSLLVWWSFNWVCQVLRDLGKGGSW